MKSSLFNSKLLSMFKSFVYNFSKSKLRSVPLEPYLKIQQSNESQEKNIEKSSLPDIEINIKKYNKKELEESDSKKQTKAIPCSPTLSPIEVI